MRLNKLFHLVFLILFSLSAYSKENWIAVNDEFYVDSASANRKGDMGQVTIKFKNQEELLEFNCKSKKLIKYPDYDFDSRDSSLGKGISMAMKVACSRWFEVWNR